MPRFFNNVYSLVSTRAPYTSTQGHRNAERGNAAAELMGTAFQSFNPAFFLPQTLAQTLISAYSIFRKDTHFAEKIIHLIQMALAATQMILGILLLFDVETCTTIGTTLCKLVFLIQLLYKGTLLVGWLPSEFSKDPYVDSASITIPAATEPLLASQPDVEQAEPEQKPVLSVAAAAPAAVIAANDQEQSLKFGP